jgi:1-acyl-sn-glycerol-3-phosphate acyltransferase
MSPERALAWLARIAKVLCWPFVRFDVDGGKQLNHELGAVVIVTDHRSLFDVVAGLIVFHRYQRYPRVLIERSFVESRWTGPFARAIGAIPVDRANRRGQALAAAIETLRSGSTVLLLPEGRLHWDPDHPLTTGPAATGVSRIAAGAGVPVVAAGMVGTERVWPAGARFPRLRPFRRAVVTVRIADAAVALEGDDDRDRTEQVMADVRRLMAEASAASSEP